MCTRILCRALSRPACCRSEQKRPAPSMPAGPASPPKKHKLDKPPADAVPHVSSRSWLVPCRRGSKSASRWSNTTKHAAHYRLPMGILSASGGLKRGYCHTVDAAGAWRWAVDVQLPVRGMPLFLICCTAACTAFHKALSTAGNAIAGLQLRAVVVVLPSLRQ